MKLRPMTSADEAAVMVLNAAAANYVDPLGPDRLDWFRLIAAHAVVVELEGKVVAFVLTFTPGSAHDSLDFQWFTATYADRFLHLDRIVVAEEHRRKGIGTMVYRAVERAAKPFDRLVCQIRSDPPSVAALAFHAARDFVEVGKLRRPDGITTALCSKELAD